MTNRYNSVEIAHRVEEAREKHNLKSDELAERIGLKPSQWYDRVRGQVPFTVEELGALADALNAPPGWPFVGHDKD
jgi:transcriptional regulator with XRE-family HTH domain